MLSEDRIRLMTKMAAYEKREERRNINFRHYSQKDYIQVQLIKTFLCSTVSFVLLFIFSILADLEHWIDQVNELGFPVAPMAFLLGYLAFVGAYQCIAYFLYKARFAKMKEENETYFEDLREALKLYDREKAEG